MANTQHHPSADTRTFTVHVDFGHGQVINLAEALDSLVEFIQEDRVTADDDNAMVCAEALARYLRTGETGTITVDRPTPTGALVFESAAEMLAAARTGELKEELRRRRQ